MPRCDISQSPNECPDLAIGNLAMAPVASAIPHDQHNSPDGAGDTHLLPRAKSLAEHDTRQ
jgi:hypothetical protein